MAPTWKMGMAMAAAGVTAQEAQLREYRGYDFDAYAAEFGKSYTEEQHKLHKSIFEENMKLIAQHNELYKAGDHTWFAAVNSLTDITPEEFGQLRSTKYNPSTHPTVTLQASASGNPASVDWRTHKPAVVTPPKNQALPGAPGCGSCWAFSATESVESAYALASGKLLELAPQTYVNCVQNPQHCGGTGGCEGATPELAFNLTVQSGIALESDLPYQASDQKCSPYKPAVKIDGYVKNPVNDAHALETAVATKGPQSITVAATSWKFYGGGIFTGCSRGLGNTTWGDHILDHGVQLVGYTSDYWLVRNSWGNWGESGYIRLSRSVDNQTFIDKAASECGARGAALGGECGVLFDTSYPTGARAASDSIVV